MTPDPETPALASPAHAAPHEQASPQLIVAGIGASAGGLKALQQFFEATDPGLGIAFVVVVHLSPEHDSELHEILARSTTMNVRQVRDTAPLEGGCVYVIPPDRRLRIDDDHVSALPFDEPRGLRAPIDLFFRSLAEQHGDGFGIVLSGGGSDGAVGVRAVKEAGGLVLVQDPLEAEYDSMPRAAIATGVADLVMPVAELGRRMADLTRTKRNLRARLGPEAPERLEEADESLLDRIFAHVHARTGHDFSRYKRATVRRRLARRMQVRRTSSLADYLDVLRTEPGEARALFDDLLISVTSFFRDPEAWAVLERSVIPDLFEKAGEDPIRIWVPGCATGEEAYSLAMLLVEEAGRRDVRPQLQIFASDLDESALAYAREGRYPAAIVADVSEARLGRFFTRHDDYFTITRELRDCVLFASHSLFRDPPFTRLDLVSCRNVMIYLDRELQEQAYAILHYALKPGAVLFVGSSEIAGPEHFHVIDKRHSLYRARESTSGAHVLPDALFASPRGRQRVPARSYAPRDAAAEVHLQALEHLAPPSILVDSEFCAAHLSETAGRYLQPPAGPLARDVTRLVRPELQTELRAALFVAFEKGVSSLSAFVPVRFNGTPVRVAMLVRPQPARNGDERFALVTFLEGGEVPAGEAKTRDEGAAAADVRELRDQLALARSALQNAREEHGATTEELRAANEELQSINEEHRSTAEELETSREELQSMNEELQTVNAELKSKLDEVRRTQSDLENLMAVTEIGILFLDRSLHIARFTAPVAELFNIKPTDRGRPIADFSRRLEYDRFEQDAREVLRTLIPIEREVQVGGDGWSLVRVRPYRTVDQRIDGVVATFVDVTVRKRSENAVREARDYAQRIVDTVREPLVVLTADLRVQSANAAFYRAFDVDAVAARGTRLPDLDRGQFDVPGLRELLEGVLEADGKFEAFDLKHASPARGERMLRLNARRLDANSILLAIEDVTEAMANEAERRRFLASAQEAREEAEAANTVKTNFMATMSHELRTPLNAIIGYAELLESGIPEAIGSQAVRHVERIRLSSKHLLHLINSMLLFSRIDAGQESLAPAAADLNVILREVNAVLEPLAAQSGIGFTARVIDAPDPVVLDAPKVRQLLVNLASNAVKFTDEGRVGVTVGQADGELVFEVTDTGMGIAADDVPHLFEPFWQGDSNLTRRAGGTGLGLAIVKRLVDMMHGSIEVISAPGEGSTFRVRLPVHPVQPQAAE